MQTLLLLIQLQAAAYGPVETQALFSDTKTHDHDCGTAQTNEIVVCKKNGSSLGDLRLQELARPQGLGDPDHPYHIKLPHGAYMQGLNKLVIPF